METSATQTQQEQDKQVAETILEQLGGAMFLRMTGAKGLLWDKNLLSMQLPNNFAKDGINRVKITLDPSDTYTVEFGVYTKRTFTYTKLHEVSGVYDDMLCRIFEDKTGLRVSL